MPKFTCTRTIIETVTIEADTPQEAYEEALNAEPEQFTMIGCDWTTEDEDEENVDDQVEYR